MFLKKKIKLTSEQWQGLTILISLYQESLSRENIHCPKQTSVSVEELLSLINHVDIKQLTALLYQYMDSIYEYTRFNSLNRNLKAVIYIAKDDFLLKPATYLPKENRTMPRFVFFRTILNFLYDYKREFTVLNSFKKMLIMALN